MKEKLEKIKQDALAQIEQSDALEKLNDVRVNFLGKKGELTAVLKSMKDVAPEDRPKVGQLVNEAREEIEAVLTAAIKKMERMKREAQMRAEVIDVTLPKAASYKCVELWDKTEENITDKLNTTVVPHGVKIFRISANQ